MEVPRMEEGKSKSHLTSPAAFVEGGIQEACEDSCSICLEAFCDSDPGTVTSCKHEFHLQCILECQELLEAVEQERRFRFNPTRNSTIFHHPTLGDFELQHLPVGVNDSELEDRIIQHLAAAAAMGRTHHVGRREGSRNRSAAHGRPQFLVFSTNPNAPSAATISASAGPVEEPAQPVAVASPVGGEAEPAAVESVRASAPSTARGGGTVQQMPASGTSHSPQGTSVIHRYSCYSNSFCGSSSSLSALPDQDIAGPSELQAVSDTWKYKESVSKSTRGWKERLFNKSPSMSNIGTEVRREVNAGIANMSRMIERLEVRENNRQDQDHDSASSNWTSGPGEDNRNHVEAPGAGAGAGAASN
ncbi:Zinc finger, RING/FYVE/PHD-type [Cynara cardunculus var. scolymus]|uniref:RING-type E3 ubiquitin transferase n=1 Tax=Cynara cardunculus var. scolymus TaxID=59895 RepID=A0A103XGY4_CYNCS|nr:Zinc finger, RING/FYVE/PHD-type [Cynara cardunculus var. scolymus]